MRRACASVTVVDFATYALSQLPPPPARVLEVGCGPDGGIVATLADAGYDTLGVDPRAPDGERFRALPFEELDEEPYDAVLAERVFHHVHPLADAVDKLARMTPLVVLDEFAWDRIDAPTQAWYEAEHRRLAAAGVDLAGPSDLDEWRLRHPGLIPSGVLVDTFRIRFAERRLEPRAYFYRWLGADTEAVEQALVDGGAIRPIGFRWVGVSRRAASPG